MKQRLLKPKKPKVNWEQVAKDCRFEPHKGQKPIIEAYLRGLREIMWVAGRRTGKSICLAFICLLEAMLPNRKIWIVAPTFELSKKVFSYFISLLPYVFENNEYKIGTKPGMFVRFANGTLVECKSAENASGLIGDEVDLLIMDEAAIMAEDIYTMYLFAATAMRRGQTIFISTPRSKNWFFRKFKEIKQDIENGFVHHSPTTDNPYLPEGEWERAKGKVPKNIFQQEYEAQFLDEGAGVFRKYNEAAIEKENCYEDPKSDHRYIVGADIAKVNDFTVITVIDKQTHKVVYWERFNKVDWALVADRIANVALKYNRAKAIIDSTGLGNPVTENIKRKGTYVEDYKFSNKSKKELIEKLSLFFDNEAIIIPNEKELLEELDVFACDLTPSGEVRYGAPLGCYDDSIMSLALAVWGLYDTKAQKPIKIKEMEKTPLELRRKRLIKRVR